MFQFSLYEADHSWLPNLIRHREVMVDVRINLSRAYFLFVSQNKLKYFD